MSGSSSCASSTASTPTRLSKPLPKATKLTIKIPTVPVMVTTSPPSPSWRVIEPRPQDEGEFRPPGLMCYPSAPSKARGVPGPTQPRQPLASVTKPNGAVDPDIAHSSRDKDEVQSGIPGQIGKVNTSSRKGTSRRKPYDPTGAPPPLKDALYAASRAKLQSKPEGKAGVTIAQAGLPQSEEDFPNPSSSVPIVVDDFSPGIRVVECAGGSQLDLVPINPTAPTSPRASIPSPPAPSKADVPLLSSVPLQIPRAHPPAPDSALAWASVPASLPTPGPSQATPLPFPRSYADLPQWERISRLRNDYSSNAFNAKAHSLEIHARDYRAGILLLSLLDVLRDRQRYIEDCRHDIQQMAWNVAEMKEMGCSRREMGVVEAHAAADEFFKSIWGCEFRDLEMKEDGPTDIDPMRRWLELKEEGASGASLPVGHIPGYPDGVHLPSLERLVGIPIRRFDGKMGEFDIQKMGRAFAEDPFEVLKGLVRGVDGSRYAPLEL